MRRNVGFGIERLNHFIRCKYIMHKTKSKSGEKAKMRESQRSNQLAGEGPSAAIRMIHRKC